MFVEIIRYERESPIYLGDYVTLDTGTGIVHSSPAYGVDDFISCKAHGMKDDDILKPVMGDGRFASTLPLFGGMTIWEASKPICNALTEAGALFDAVGDHGEDGVAAVEHFFDAVGEACDGAVVGEGEFGTICAELPIRA